MAVRIIFGHPRYYNTLKRARVCHCMAKTYCEVSIINLPSLELTVRGSLKSLFVTSQGQVSHDNMATA